MDSDIEKSYLKIKKTNLDNNLIDNLKLNNNIPNIENKNIYTKNNQYIEFINNNFNINNNRISYPKNIKRNSILNNSNITEFNNSEKNVNNKINYNINNILNQNNFNVNLQNKNTNFSNKNNKMNNLNNIENMFNLNNKIDHKYFNQQNIITNDSNIQNYSNLNNLENKFSYNSPLSCKNNYLLYTQNDQKNNKFNIINSNFNTKVFNNCIESNKNIFNPQNKNIESDKGNIFNHYNKINTDKYSNLSNEKPKKKPFLERIGDWVCFKCKNLNFSFRQACNRCQQAKYDNEKLNDNSNNKV
jgi:hypothetical protein